ncbi:RNA 3'-terminal phosphate cyclase-like [Euwallacea fornicatus]|uniref:RNA 3'-terminal phosphate cyclase-like n=1 Tax=Euwallacea fornicatus TaxID=995702 RepID=UPI00338F28C6
MSETVTIDGSLLEGGGQILRVALTLSCLKRIPIRIYNIRAGRSKPGLMEQHLKGLELVKDLSNAHVSGASIGSTEISFSPKEIVGGTFNAFVKTAGSISLLLQVALPCALFAQSPINLRLRGGTNAEMAPQVDYMTEVFRPVLEKFGATFDFELVRRGYFPKGGGEVAITIQPVKELKGIHLINPGKVTSISGWSFVAGALPPHISNRMADSARRMLLKVCRNINIESYKEDRNVAVDNASGIILTAYTDTECILGADALGKRNESPEKTGERASEMLLKNMDQQTCVDSHCQDQIIIFMALASGPSSVKTGEITLHTKTAIYVVETLTKVKFNVETLETGGNIIHCTGSR